MRRQDNANEHEQHVGALLLLSDVDLAVVRLAPRRRHNAEFFERR